MNKILKHLGTALAGLGIAASSMWSAKPAHAGTATANLDVSAYVTANCTISTAALTFGAYDPVSANATSPLDAQGGVNVTCTSGSSVVITLGQGMNAAAGSSDALPARQMISGSSTLAYSLYTDSAHSAPWGNTGSTGDSLTGSGAQQSLPIYGEIPGGQNVPVGQYADTVIATVTF